jgi:hypothetical protein
MNSDSVNPENVSAEPQKPKKCSVFRRLIEDRRISTGAFKFWHILHDNKDRDGRCWLGRRAILEKYGQNFASQQKYRDLLVESGWLKVTELKGEAPKRGDAHVYTILAGDGNPLRSVTDNGISDCYRKWKQSTRYRKRKRGVTTNGNTALPRSVSKDTSYSKEGKDSKVVISPASLLEGDSASQSPPKSAEKGMPNKNADGGGSEKFKDDHG